jgi:hypothetical protein
MNPLLLTPILEVAGKVFDKLFPDKQAAESAKAQFALEASKLDQASTDKFYEFVTKYEGEGASVSPFLQIYRGSVRPTITYGLVAALIWAFWSGQPATNVEILAKLNFISLGFWYGERALSNLGLDLSKWTTVRKAQAVNQE